MRIPRALRLSALALLLFLLAGVSMYFYVITPHPSSAPPDSAQALLDRADSLSWGNRWIDAEPLYKRAEQMFAAQGQSSKALYAQVSQIPPNESVDLPATIWALTQDLTLSAAANPETRLRILTIRGMLEIDYNAVEALSTWTEISSLAVSLRHYSIATRAMGEQGIAAFLLGDTETAKKKVIRAWMLSKVENDPAATVRYASLFGAGLVQIQRYNEALSAVNEAIRIAKNKPEIAYPAIAIYSKIDALVGLHRPEDALALADRALAQLEKTPYDGYKSQVYLSRGRIDGERGDWEAAIADYNRSLEYSIRIKNFRGITDAGGLLAKAYAQNHDLPSALAAIDSAITANTKIPAELYLMPRNLAIKAEIAEKMGRAKEAESLYLRGIALVDTMIRHASTTNIQRQLLVEMGDVYTGYFAFLCARQRYADALRTLEQIRGRVEAEALEHHVNEVPHAPTPEESELTRLNLELVNSDDPDARTKISKAIYNAELALGPSTLAQETTTHPVPLEDLQRSLSPNTVLVEYVLADPSSYALAVTHNEVTPYQLTAKSRIETDSERYISEIRSKKVNKALAQALYKELLGPVREIEKNTNLIVVPDGSLHLLPFSALMKDDAYVISRHTVDVVPSSTVYSILEKRVREKAGIQTSFLGVAAWTQIRDTRSRVVREISAPQRSALIPLPESKLEVESIAKDLPPPSTILLGTNATETNFKRTVSDDPEVIHLALHGYVDLDYPDRSALVFAPEKSGINDGLLQVREIRGMRINSKLVTLSACNTGVGPVGEVGVANLVNAFIEAGADSVVSTLWEVEDESTMHLMISFYSQLARHERKIDALRSAQVEVMNKGFPPYFWADVQLVGDPNGTL